MTLNTVLIVDDNPENLAVLGGLLRGSYRVLAANSGQRALDLVRQGARPDLALLDVMMPGLDGYAVLRTLRAEFPSLDIPVIPVIFVTALDGSEDEEHGLALGAADYIVKPLQPAIVLARVRTHVALKQARDRLNGHNTFLEAEVARRMEENQRAQDVSIRALARLAEVRDTETGNHLRRTQEYARTLARALRAHPRHAATLDEATITLIAKSAPLHDIGKVGIPDHILLKPGKLTPEEWAVMRTHASLGAEAIEQAERLERWMRRELAEVAFIASSENLGDRYLRWIAQGGAASADPLTRRLSQYVESNDYAGMRLLDAAGNTLAARGPVDETPPAVRRAALAAMAAGASVFSDTYIARGSDGTDELSFDVVAPMLATGTPPRAAIAIRIDPRRTLQETLYGWPVRDGRGYSQLVRRTVDGVIDTGTGAFLPLATPGLAFARSIRDELETGRAVDGVDFHGVPVVAAVRRIGSTEWYVVANTERAHISAATAAQSVWIVGPALLLHWLPTRAGTTAKAASEQGTDGATEPVPTAPAALDIAAALAALDHLEILVEAADFDAGIALREASAVLRPALGNAFAALEAKLHDFDYPAALALVRDQRQRIAPAA
jgi:response regulator RpfG family c-di-GMP phosphodiesterase